MTTALTIVEDSAAVLVDADIAFRLSQLIGNLAALVACAHGPDIPHRAGSSVTVRRMPKVENPNSVDKTLLRTMSNR